MRGAAMVFVMGLGTFLRAVLSGSAGIALENMALRHQLLVLQRSAGRPRLARRDRIFWVWRSRLWASGRSSLVTVQPATVLTWHRQGFQLCWRWKSRPNPVGRPRLDAELRGVIRRMKRENPTEPGACRSSLLDRRPSGSPSPPDHAEQPQSADADAG
jgi:hypothetical protein